VSWDVFIFAAPDAAASADQIPHDFDPPPLGTATEIRQRLRDGLPEAGRTSPEEPGISALSAEPVGGAEWGRLDGPTWSIEVNIGADDPVRSILLYVRGTGDDVLPVIGRIVAASGGRALDISTGEFLTGDPAETAGWHGFQRCREQILRG
jgi:hypothetical protein